MSNYLAIATVTAAVRRVLQNAVGVDVSGATATMVRPDGPSSGVPPIGVNIFLYQVTPNASLRNNDLPTRQSTGTLVRLPQVALDLYYLLSFYGDETELEPQRILGSTIRTLHVQPVLTRQNIQTAIAENLFLSNSDLAEAVESVKFTPMPLNLEELSKLWSVLFQTTYVLSTVYQASVVLISPDRQPIAVQPVQEPVILVQPSVDSGEVSAAEPDTLDDLQLWLRADADVTYNNAGLVSQWGDRSGNDNHAVQNVAARRPSFVRDGLNGKPVMRFDGVDDYLAIENLHYDTPGQIDGITIVALVKSFSSDNQILVSFDRNEYWQLSLQSVATNGVGWQTRSVGGTVDDLQTDSTYTDGRWHAIACWFDPGASPDKQIVVDGEAAAVNDAHGGENLGSGVTRFGFVGVGSQADVVDGAIGPEEFLAGDLAELAIYDRVLTERERQQLERYFVEKYASS